MVTPERVSVPELLIPPPAAASPTEIVRPDKDGRHTAGNREHANGVVAIDRQRRWRQVRRSRSRWWYRSERACPDSV